MTTSKLPPEGHELLAKQLDSFEKLELLHVLCTAGRPMSTAELETACRFAADTVSDVLRSLTQLGVLDRVDEGKLFQVSAAARQPGFDAVMALYKDDRTVVMGLLTTIALDRIRGMAARAFAKAFVLRKRDDDG